jgi:hypothetical protein
MITANNITAQGLTMGTMTPKASNQWTNASTGLNAATFNNNSSTFGTAASTTEPTMPANIIRPNTTKQFGPSTLKTHITTPKILFPYLHQFTFTYVDPMIQLWRSHQHTSQAYALARVCYYPHIQHMGT